MAKKQTATVVENPNDWKLVHIMGHGKTRLNTATEKEVVTTELTKAEAVIAFMLAKKPADSNAGTEFHVITIARDLFVRFIPKNKDEKPYSIKYPEMDATLVADLVAELEAFVLPVAPSNTPIL
jgi:hypothetical protein